MVEILILSTETGEILFDEEVDLVVLDYEYWYA